MASQLSSGAPTYGLMYELYVIAAVVVGGTSLSGGSGRIFGTLIGAFIFLFITAVRSQRIVRHRMFVVLILTFFSLLFWAFFEQAGSSVNNFTDRNVDRVSEARYLTDTDVGKTIKFRIPPAMDDEVSSTSTRGPSMGSIADTGSPSLLTSPGAQQSLVALCNELEISPAFIPALKDWLDDNLEPEYPDGAEDDYYTRLEQPYRTANRLMVDVSELRLLKGMDAEKFSALKPFITALPESTGINLNTVSEQVFNSLGLELNYQAVVDARDEDAFADLQDFEQRMSIALEEDQKKYLAVATDYFLADGQVTINDKTVYIKSLIERDGKGQTHVLSRNLGDIL